MATYKVIAPYVIAKTVTSEGVRMKGLNEGALVPDDVPEEWLAHHLRKKLIEKLPEPEAALTPAPASEQGGQSEEVPSTPQAAPPGPETAQAPPESGPGSGKQAWVEYAVARGMSREEAGAMSRDDLIAALREG
ncbi:hypothetical protein AB0L05_27700 [Nonomuraea pusilla]|uniref:hypothetical protein n=1 Tax=Nonomuraea pusilla TaxID=46177 RepID=UPI0033272A50